MLIACYISVKNELNLSQHKHRLLQYFEQPNEVFEDGLVFCLLKLSEGVCLWARARVCQREEFAL
jgi:hypothetical protein